MEVISDITSSSRSNQCDLIISGRIVNTKNLDPIPDAVISGEQFSAITDENGEFSVSISLIEDRVTDVITVKKEGFLVKEFKAFFGSVAQLNTCPDITNISWDIAISEQQEGVWVGPKDGAWYKIMDTVATRCLNDEGIEEVFLITNIYSLDIRRGAFDEPRKVIVSLDHSRATGPGLPSELKDFVIVSFNVEVLGGSDGLQSIASSSNEEVFLLPLDIRFQLPSAFNPYDFSSIDLGDLEIDTRPLTIDGEGNLVYFQTADGTHCIGFTPLLSDVIQPVLEALQNGATLEEINMVITEGLTTVGVVGNGSGVTEVISDIESNGRIANKESFSNCDCSNPVSQNFSATLDGVEDLYIMFPPSATIAQKVEAVTVVRDLIGISGDENQAVSINFDLDKCSTVTVCSQEIIRTASGTVNGFPFTYRGTDRLETTVEEESDCPTTTPCHQGCPG